MTQADKKPPLKTLLLVLLVICGWFALVAQMKLNLESKAAPLKELIIRYFSYFTLLTNLLVAIFSTALLVAPRSSIGKFCSRYAAVTAVTANILVVGLVYNIILRPLWQPTGLQKPVDELLHTVIPLLFLCYWLFVVPKKRLSYQSILPWLLYPLLYVIFVLTRGSFSGFYPYPFIDLNKLPIQQVFFNSVGIAIGVITISVMLVAVGNLISKRSQ